MEIFIDSFIEQFVTFLRTYDGILSIIAVVPLAALIFYVISFIPVQILNFLKFRRRIKEFKAFEITVTESFKRHYELLEQLEKFLKQRISSTKNFTQGKIPISQEISTAHWQLYESDFAEAIKATATVLKRYSSLRTYPQFQSVQKRIDEQRLHLQSIKKSYNLMVYNYNTTRRGKIFTFLFALLTGNKAKELISLKETAPNTLLNEEPKQENQVEFPPLKTNAEFKQFYDNVLIHKIQPLEELRREYARQIQKIILIATPIVIALILPMIIFSELMNEEAMNEHPFGFLFILLPFSMVMTIIVASKKIKAIKNKRIADENADRRQRIERIMRRLNSATEEFSDYETAFYTQIITPIVSFVSDKLEYNQHAMSNRIFTASALFSNPDKYSSPLGLTGIINQKRFVFSEVVTYIKAHSEHVNSRRGPTYHSQFTGLFYTIDFSKKLKGNIYLLPTNVVKDLKKVRARRSVSHQQHICKNNMEIRFIDDPDFEKKFSVFAEDSVSAYSLLTPSLRDFFVEIQKQFKGKRIYSSFVAGKFYVAIYNSHLGFKPSLMKTLLNYDKIEKTFERIRWVLKISQKFEKAMQ